MSAGTRSTSTARAADDIGASCRTKPFQIPLGALIPVRVDNLLPARKNIGTTHITNGCYRLHPVEWNIGEAAGTLAAFAIENDVAPAAVRERPYLLERFQRRLLERGVPIVWPDDPDAGPRPEADDPAFARNQLRSLQRALEETT